MEASLALEIAILISEFSIVVHKIPVNLKSLEDFWSFGPLPAVTWFTYKCSGHKEVVLSI